MADLSTLDPTLPADTDAVGQGASRIREERSSLLTSFAVEHLLSGAHKFLLGSQAGRPAVGDAGRIYLNVIDNRVELDTGNQFNILHAVQRYAIVVASISVPNNTETVVTSAVIDVPNDGLILCLGMINLAYATNQSSIFVVPSFKIGSDYLNPGGASPQYGFKLPSIALDFQTVTHFGWAFNAGIVAPIISTGAHTVRQTVKVSTITGNAVVGSTMVVLVL